MSSYATPWSKSRDMLAKFPQLRHIDIIIGRNGFVVSAMPSAEYARELVVRKLCAETDQTIAVTLPMIETKVKEAFAAPLVQASGLDVYDVLREVRQALYKGFPQ